MKTALSWKSNFNTSLHGKEGLEKEKEKERERERERGGED